MRRRTSAIALLTAISILIWPAAASAQTPIVEADFETTFAGFGYSYAYAGYGSQDCTVNNDSGSQVDALFDVDGFDDLGNPLPGAVGTMDTSQWVFPPAPESCYNYAGWGLGVGFLLPGGVLLASGDLEDYSVTFDASVAGYDPGDSGLNTELKVIFQAPDNEDEDGDVQAYVVGVNNGNPGAFPIPVLTSTPQTLTVNLGDLAIFAADSDYDFATEFSDTFIMMLELAPNVNAGEIGFDADNVIAVDNIRFDGPTTTVGAGDFDFDLDVDGEDFLIWQRGGLPNGVESTDLDDWRANYGFAPAAAAVPEPAGFATICAVAAALAACRGGGKPDKA